MDAIDYAEMHYDKLSYQKKFYLGKLEVMSQLKYKSIDRKITSGIFRYWPVMASKHLMLRVGQQMHKAMSARLTGFSSN